MAVMPLVILAAAAWAVAALLFQRARAKAYGSRALFSAPAGSPQAGIRYAFTQGMRPDAKESVREHLPSYLAGMAYHVGAFTALAQLVLCLTGVERPMAVFIPMQILLAGGVLGGGSLLLKRVLNPELRGLSHPDDYVSNLLVTVFIALAMSTLHNGLHTAWHFSAVALLVYLPLGKIRHCLFFFSTRAAFGAFFGRRGVFPTGGSHGR